MPYMENSRPPDKLTLVECPRDAMQGWHDIIPTEKKIEYLNSLLRVGFDTLDFGSFVSARAIPQMADTAAVLEGLDNRWIAAPGKHDPADRRTRLLAIVANFRGAEEAATFKKTCALASDPLIPSNAFPLSTCEYWL